MTEGLSRWRETFWKNCTCGPNVHQLLPWHAESLTVSFRGSMSLATPLTPVFSPHLSNHTKSLGTNITNLSDRRVQPAWVHLSANLHLTCRKPRLCKAGLKVDHFCISCSICLLMLCNLQKLEDVFDGDLFLWTDSCRDELLCLYHLFKKKKSCKAELEGTGSQQMVSENLICILLCGVDQLSQCQQFGIGILSFSLSFFGVLDFRNLYYLCACHNQIFSNLW